MESQNEEQLSLDLSLESGNVIHNHPIIALLWELQPRASQHSGEGEAESGSISGLFPFTPSASSLGQLEPQEGILNIVNIWVEKMIRFIIDSVESEWVFVR